MLLDTNACYILGRGLDFVAAAFRRAVLDVWFSPAQEKTQRQNHKSNAADLKVATTKATLFMVFLHKNIRLPAPRYEGEQWHFVTICCAGRRPLLIDAGRAAWIIDELRRHAAAHEMSVYAFCAMPDHLHVLVMGLRPTSHLLPFVKGLKQKTAYEFRKKVHRDLWQKKFYDHILRQDDSVERVAGYIWMNPVRKGICADPREYPYSGSFAIDWAKGLAPIGEWVPPWKGSPVPAKAGTEKKDDPSAGRPPKKTTTKP